MSAAIQHTRFKDAPWFPEREEKVMIGGAGGIGSWLTLLLARAGFSPVVFDFDKIEEHNLGGQLFRSSDIGKYKVDAIYSMVETFSQTRISIFKDKIDKNSPTHHFMFSAFDNMKARKDLFNVWKKSHETCSVTPIFIDGRLTMEQIQIFCVTPSNMDAYEEEHLFDDFEVEDVACTLKQTSHSASLIASLMTMFFTNHITNIYEREVVREVPAFYEFFGPIVYTQRL